MEEKIEKLFRALNIIAMNYLFDQKHNNIDDIKELVQIGRASCRERVSS